MCRKSNVLNPRPGERGGLMLSVVIATDNSERVLVPTLAALVPGAATGLVREVILADGGSRDGTAAIADEAGCRLEVATAPLGDRLRAAATTARGSWLLFLHPGIVLDSTWIGETTRFVQRAERTGRVAARAATFRPSGETDTLLSTVAEGFALIAAALGARPSPRQGLLIAKSFYDALGGHGHGADAEARFLRTLGRRRIAILRSRAMATAM